MRCWRLPRYDYKNNKNHSVFVFLFRSIAFWPSLTFFFSASRHFFLPVCPSYFSLILLFPSSRPSPFQPLQTLRSVILFRPLFTLQRFPFFFSIPSLHTTLSDYAPLCHLEETIFDWHFENQDGENFRPLTKQKLHTFTLRLKYFLP